MSLSNMLSNTFFTIVKNNLPSSVVISDAKLKEVIKNALSRYHSLYVDNDLGLFDETILIDFYNSAQNEFINTRDLTRWVGITPPNFRATKLISCMLKEATPDLVEYPSGISYIQDIPIQIKASGEVNVLVPGSNSGACSLWGNTKLMNVLTLGDENSWTNLGSITALLTYYRPIEIPEFSVDSESEMIDIEVKDINLVVNYVIESIMKNNTPLFVRQLTQKLESNILY